MKKCEFTALLLLLSVSAAALASCGESGTVPTETEAAPVSETAAVTEQAETAPYFEPDGLPDTLDFGGADFHLFGWESNPNNEFFAEQDGDLIHDAIYNRNKTVEERLNVTLSFTREPGNNANKDKWVKSISSSIMAGDGAYDASAGYSMAGATLAYKGLVQNLLELDYLDFSKPWWPHSLIDEALCGGKLYFCSGDISTNFLDFITCTFFNKKLLQDYDLENPYELVRNGTWTLDKLESMAAGVYKDINGDGKKDEYDQFGYYTTTVLSDILFFSSGLSTTTIGADGLPVLSESFGGEKAQALLENLIRFFDTDDACLAAEVVYGNFAQGTSLFFTGETCSASYYFRESDFEYGIVPMPKWDEAQESYRTGCSFTYTLYGIPVDVRDAAMSAAVLECLASESYRTVSPAHFETALKVKYASDEDASEMYDIIRASNSFDFGRIFNDSMSSMTYSLFRTALVNKNANWISQFEKNQKSLTKALEKVVKALTEEN